MYLIDSDVLIYFLKGDSQAITTIKKLKDTSLYVSVISVGEILEGLQGTFHKKKLAQFRELLQTVTIINIDLPIIEKFAQLRRSLRAKGLLIDNFDLLIASTCLVHSLSIITNNSTHFRRIEGLKMHTIKE
jgi:predicted nucleic acid-binding protein